MSSTAKILQDLLQLKPSVVSSLEEVSNLDICIKTLLREYLTDDTKVNGSSSIFADAIVEYMYDKVNVGSWKEVKPALNKAITIGSYLRLIFYLHTKKDFTDAIVQTTFKIVDFGILFGCPLDAEPKLLQKCASILNSIYNPLPKTDLITTKSETLPTTCEKSNFVSLDILDCPSMEFFYKNYILKQKPAVLDNCINHWPALSKWKDMNYFRKIAGMRTVTVEIGRKYTDENWTQKLMTIDEYITEHIYKANGPTGYLAQYHLFDHLPELKNDITEPEYCCFSNNDDPVNVMAWFGPKGTISPVHFDAKRNLLAQVIGEKQIFMYPPTDSQFLYPHEHELLHNTARVDPRQPDLQLFPEYKNATAYYYILKPGQMLYIPPKWWHFVESLSVSFSVSFWWE